MEVSLKVPEYELEVILEALKDSATLYGSARVTAFTTGDTKKYLEYQEKKTYAWQAYDHLKNALERHREEDKLKKELEAEEVEEFWTLCEAYQPDGDCDKCEMCEVMHDAERH